MKKLSTQWCRLLCSSCLTWVTATVCWVLYAPTVLAQESNLTCNAAASTNWVNTPFSLTQTNSGTTTLPINGWNDPGDVIDNGTSNFALTSGTFSDRFIRVGDPTNDYNASGTETYYVGFRVGSGVTAFVGNLTIKTYLNGNQRDVYTTPYTGAITSSNDIGFTTRLSFDAIEVSASGLGAFRVYYPLIRRFCAGTPVASATCNTPIALNFPAYPVIIDDDNTGIAGGALSLGSISDPGNAISTDPADYATLTMLASVAGGSVNLAVKDLVTTYPSGTFVGFDIQNTGLLSIGLLGSIEVTGLLNGSAVAGQVATGSNLLLSAGVASSSGRQTIGFVTTAPINGIKISIKSGLLDVNLLGATRVYSAVFKRFCAATPGLVCNTPTLVTSPTYPVFVNAANTGYTGAISANSGVQNTANLVDADATNYASIVLPVGVAVNANLSVKDQITEYPAGTFAGFDIENTALIGVDALSGIKIETYNNGVPTSESVASGSLASVTSSILSGTGRQTIGFVASVPFDEVKLTVQQTGVDLGTIRVYGAVLTKFSADCPVPDLACNTLTPVANPTHPVYVSGRNTGFTSALCAGCTINNSERAVDSDPSNYASIVLTANALGTASFAVANAIDTYQAGSFAGFHIETPTLVSADVIGSATISLYNNGTLVQAASPSVLLAGVTANLLTSGPNSQTVGIVATVPFDEVKITFNQVATVNLGTVRIYNAIVQKSCSNTIACNNTYFLNRPTFPVVIDAAKTGASGIASVGLGNAIVNEPWNVVSASTSDFASIKNNVSGVASVSLAVVDPVNTFPTGTFAGFTLRRVTNLVTLDLLNALTVTTYLDGQQQESKTGGNLLDLTLILQIFGTTASDFVNVGFVTTKPFDEIKLTVGSLASVAALSGSIDVFGAFIDTRTSSGDGLACAITTNPDFAVTNKNVPVAGNVRTNDIVPTGTTYGPTPTLISGPSGATPTWTLTSSGSFTFTSATPGVYVYSVPVCTTANNCVSEKLTITVLDPTVNTNNPVANPDIVSMTGAPTATTAVTINVRVNDGPGNPGGTLGDPSVVSGPTNGTATIVGGNVQYKPANGFYGTDVFTYQVCETPNQGSPLCSTATVTITVKAPNSANTTLVADDYVSTFQGLPVSGNVSTNDSDPEGNTQTVATQNTTIPGKGTFVLTSTGSFTFTPTAGSTGPVDFTYTVSDNGLPSVSASGTLHILVNPFNPNPDFSVSNVGVPTAGSVRTNDIVPVGTTYGPTATLVSQPSGSSPTLTLTSTGSYTFTSTTPGVYVYSVPVCATATYCVSQSLTITVLDPNVTTNRPVVNPDFALIIGSPTAPPPVNINVKANDGPGNTGGTLGDPTIAQGPSNGTASIVGGNVQYTPNAGFYGVDVLTYQVCEPGSSTNCATATVTITVQAPGGPTVVSINDDYVSTSGGTQATGNVLNNDLGNNLNVSNTGTTTTSSGTLVITNTGSFTFTPAPGVTGPTEFTYTACDAAGTCGSATIHVLVNQGFPDLTPSQFLSSAQIAEGQTVDVLVSIRNVSGTSTNGTVRFYVTNYVPSTGLTMVVNTDPSVTIGGTSYQLNTSDFAISSNNFAFTLESVAGPSGVISANGRKFIAFKITRATGSTKGDVTNTVTIEDGTGGGETPVNNNTISNRFFKQ
ncbi:beta strand repeat-containing protein [Spirosoma terrae]|uniref:Tandem-95 repeat protein n=1 Tax=Spirosoma terrae TaxID=1968276 RepID=A0A6L9LGT4_9BACT|nr:tandem-95 repeat protein [Spirosoma terrae]NDU95849.1 tandem-95 repeat protein [Spirosoma terrae]